MTSSIINYIVEKYLANILIINPEETKSSLWSGTFEMANLKIKPEIFQTLNLPYLQLMNGYVGKLKIELALPRFYLYPIKVTLEKVFFHARQKNMDKLNREEEIKGLEYYKTSKLQTVEELQSEVNKFNTEAPGMVAQILNNLQITINDICVRYDDDISHKQIPYSVGLIIKQLFLHTTNDQFDTDMSKYTSNIPFDEVNHKLINMTNLNIYLDTFDSSSKCDYHNYLKAEACNSIDSSLAKFLGNTKDYYAYCLSELNYHINDVTSHEYLLFQLGFNLKISLNEKLSNGKPKIYFSCELNELQTGFSLEQIAVFVKLLQYINYSSLYQLGISKEFYTKQLSNEEQYSYMSIYSEYYKLRYLKSNIPEAEKKKVELKQFEAQLTFDQIQTMREASLIQLNYLKSIDAVDEEIKKQQAGNSSWNPLSYYWSTSSAEKSKEIEVLLNKKASLEQNKEDVHRKMEEHLKSTKAEEVNELKSLKDDFVLYDLYITIPKCIMNIYEERNKPCISINFNKFEVKCQMKKCGQFFSLSMKTLAINQSKLVDSQYTTLMKTIELPDVSSATPEDKDSIHKADLKAFYIEFENNPHFPLSNYRIKFRNDNQLIITLNLFTIQFFSQKLIDCLNSNSFNLDNIKSYATSEAEKYIMNGYQALLVSGNYQHFNVDLDIFFQGPIVIIPQKITDYKNKKGVLIKCGDIAVKSKLPPRQDFVKNDYELLTDRNLMYDGYVIDGENFYIETFDSFNGELTELQNVKKLDILEDVHLEIEFLNLIESKNQLLENFNVNCKIAPIQITLRDTQLLYFIDFIDGMYKINKLLIEENKKSNKQKYQIIEEPLNIIKQKEDPQHNSDNNDDEEIVIVKKKSEPIIELASNENANKNDNENENEVFIENKAKKDKTFFRMAFLIEKVEFKIMKSASLNDLNSHKKSKKIEILQEYKDYITFMLDAFSYSLTMSNDGNINLSMNIKSIGLIDNSSKNDHYREIIGRLHILPIQSNSKEQKKNEILIEDSRKSIDVSVKKNTSSILELSMINPEANHSDTSIKPPIDNLSIPLVHIGYNYNTQTKITSITFSLSQLKLCILLPSLLDLWLFYNYYLGKYSQMCDENIILDTMRIEEDYYKLKEIEQMQKKLDNPSSFSFDINNNYIERVKKIKPKLLKKSTNIIIKAAKKAENETKSTSESHMRISIETNSIQLLFPISETSFEKVEYFFSMSTIIDMNNHCEIYTSTITHKANRINYLLKEMRISVLLYDMGLDITYSSHIKTEKERLLTNYRMAIILNSFIIPSEERSITNINIHLEPMAVIAGFDEINILRTYAGLMSKFYGDMYKEEYSDPIVSAQTLKNENEEISLEEAKKLLRLKKKIKRRVDKMAKKSISITEYNTSSFNSITDMTLIIDKIALKLFDHQKLILWSGISEETPLLSIDLVKLEMKYLSNSIPNDIDNMSLALIEMIGRKVYPVDAFNPYTLASYFSINMFFELNYFNSNVSDWEPLIEPYGLNIKSGQVASFLPSKMDIMSPNMLNGNISIPSLKIINTLMKRFSSSNNNIAINSSNNALIHNDYRADPVIAEFTNKTGLEVDLSFAADPSTSYTLTHNNKKEFKKSQIKSIYKKLINKEIKLLKEDKVNLSIPGYYAVEGIDFSYDHFSAYSLYQCRLDSEEIQIQNEILFRKHLDISIRIKSNGLTRTIIINSNASINNSSQYYIELFPIRKSDYVHKYKRDANNINFDEIQSLKFPKNKKVFMPAQWVIDQNDMMVFISIPNANRPMLLYDPLDFLTLLKNEKARTNTKEAKTFEDVYAKRIEFTLGSNYTVSLISSILVMKPIDDDSEGIVNNELQELITNDYTNTASFVITFKSPLVIQNKIPFPVMLNINNNEVNTHLLPLEFNEHYDMNNINKSLKLKLTINNDDLYSNDIPNFLNLANEKNEGIILIDLMSIDKKTKLQCKAKINKSVIPKEIYDKFKTEYKINIINFLTQGMTITFCFDFLVVNKTNIDLYVSEAKNLTNQALVMKNSVMPFTPNPKAKLVIKTKDSDWSTMFAPTTIGLTGVLRLITKDEKNHKHLVSQDIAVLISSSSSFDQSIILTIEPRYIIENKLGIEILYCQYDFSSLIDDSCIELIKLKDNQRQMIQYSFESSKEKKKIKPQFQIAFNSISKSSPFFLDSIGVFDIQIPIDKEKASKLGIPEDNVITTNGITYALIKVIIHSKDNALLNIILTFPEYPLHRIVNKTSDVITIKQHISDTRIQSTEYVLIKDESIPLIFEDLISTDDKSILCDIDGSQVAVFFSSLESITHKGKSKSYVLSVELENKQNSKVLIIQEDNLSKERKEIVGMLFSQKKTSISKISISLPGLGLSIIDAHPRELLFISLYGIDVKYNSFVFKRKNIAETVANLIVYLKNFQIDYCLDNSFKNILVPKMQLIPLNESKRIEDDNDEIIPFIQLLLSKMTTVDAMNTNNNNQIVKYPQIDFSMQEMNLNIDQTAIVNILNAIYSLMDPLDYLFPKPEKTSMSNNIIIIDQIKEVKLKELKEYETALNTEIESIDDILNEISNSSNMLINYLMIGSVKINITLRLDLNSLEICILPDFVINIIAGLGNSIAKISDSPLRFSELLLENVFLNSGKIVSLLMKHYQRQGLIQVCKLLGSSDLIGNPVGFIDKIGTGFIEFFNEPRKGFVKGPIHFTKGIAQGFGSLVGNILEGSFAVVGNITGSLLTIAKNLQGEKIMLREEDEPDNILSGIYEGFKGGAIELSKGFTGIFLHPYRLAKEEGVLGFFKGLGIGLLNTVISPFSAVLKLGNSIFVGLKNTAKMLQRNKLSSTRFRQPRHIIKSKALTLYDEDYAEVKALIHLLCPSYYNEKLIYYKDLYLDDFMYSNEISTLILTDKHLMIIYNSSEFVLNIENSKISSSELHYINDTYSFIIKVNDKNNSSLFFTTKDGVLCRELYYLLSML